MSEVKHDNALDFKRSAALTMGVELELQIVDRRTGDLTRGASDLLRLIERRKHPGDIKPEITESMIEISTSVHRARTARASCARPRPARAPRPTGSTWRIAGGGAHPFQHWSDRQHLRPPALPVHRRPVWLPRQAVHRVRPARAHRLRERQPTALRLLHSAVALRAALHRAGGQQPVLPGRGQRVSTPRA